jgi:DNA-binding MarR family transcriptional regulator
MVDRATHAAGHWEIEAVNQPIQRREPKSINFRLHTLASSLFKGAAQYYGAHFDIGLPEMRILSNLGSEGPLAAHQLVSMTAMDKALVSRVLSTLRARGLLNAAVSKTDQRRRTWRLSAAGRDLVGKLQPEWKRREAIIQAGLSKSERRILADLLDRMLAASEKLRAEEARQLAGRKSTATRSNVRRQDDGGERGVATQHIWGR